MLTSIAMQVDDFELSIHRSGYGKLVNLASSESEGSDDEHAPLGHKKINGSVTGSIISKKNGVSDLKNKSSAASSSSSASVGGAADAKKSTGALASNPISGAALEEARKKQGGEAAAGAVAAPKPKKKRDSTRLMMYTVANGVTVEVGTGQPSVPNANGGSGVLATIICGDGSSALPGTANGTVAATATAASTTTVVAAGAGGTLVVEGISGDPADPTALETKLIHPDLEGPMSLCQPLWPAFMQDLPTRDTSLPTTSQRNLTNYLRDLEFRRDAQDQVILPEKYRARCRVGRGGRVVVDRIPVRLTLGIICFVVDSLC